MQVEKLARENQVLGLRAQMFHATYGKFDRLKIGKSCDFIILHA
jgi:hypothetical protein